MWKSRSGILSGLAMRAFYTENIKSSVPTGSMPEVENALRRCRGSMKQILSLMEVPSLETDPELAKKEKEMREQLLPGERRRVWAIEPDGPASRQPLPSWVSDPIQGAIVQWIEQKQKWDTEIESRAAKGKNLTFLQQRHYDEWKTSSREVVILFNNNKLYINWRLKQLHKQGYNQDFLQYLELLVNLDNSLRCIFMINFGMRVVVPLYAQISKKLISGCSWFSALPW